MIMMQWLVVVGFCLLVLGFFLIECELLIAESSALDWLLNVSHCIYNTNSILFSIPRN